MLLLKSANLPLMSDLLIIDTFEKEFTIILYQLTFSMLRHHTFGMSIRICSRALCSLHFEYMTQMTITQMIAHSDYVYLGRTISSYIVYLILNL